MRASRFLAALGTSCISFALSAAPAPEPQPSDAESTLTYPAARKSGQSDTYHGQSVADPYRWMEDLDAPELKQWIDGQNAVTQAYLADAPGRERIKQRLTALWQYERYGVPQVHAGRYFYTRNDGLQNQAPVYWQDALDGKPRLLIDPNTLSTDGTIALSEWAVTDDGKRFAYSLSDGGSDWRTIKVRDVASGKDLNDEVRWAKFTNIAWRKDGSGFFYSRFEAPAGEDELKAVNKNQKLYFHRLGTPQSQDQLVYERKDQPDWGFGAQVSDDGRYLIIEVSLGTDERNLLFYKDLTQKDGAVTPLVDEFESAYNFVGNRGSVFFVKTDHAAERYRVMAIDVNRPQPEHWKEVIAQSAATLVSVSHLNQQLVANYLKDAHSLVQVYDTQGKLVRELQLPGLGTAAGFYGSPGSKETFYAYTDFTTPSAIYRLDLGSGKSHAFKQPKLAFDPGQYETKQVFYPSRDGTRIPMFITGKKGFTADGNRPTLLYGYGGFNIPLTPTFNASNIVWMEMGGVYAVANLRGGGEYGRAWHEAGMKTHKQNVFDDFAAAAEYLIAQKITQPKRLAIHGRSNGGLLAAATMLQRPELFGAAIPAVGVLDMLRFREFTIGWAWESDYGSVKNPEEFKAIYRYSPLHNIRPGTQYPPTLVTTADRDDRVFPAHSFKFAAQLQDTYRGPNPMLIRIETRAGHGAGKPTSKIIEEQADQFAFLTKALGITDPLPAQ